MLHVEPEATKLKDRSSLDKSFRFRKKSMLWKDHPVLAKARRIARLRHKLRDSLRRRGWARTLRLG
jgi:hypothetical protein